MRREREGEGEIETRKVRKEGRKEGRRTKGRKKVKRGRKVVKR